MPFVQNGRRTTTSFSSCRKIISGSEKFKLQENNERNNAFNNGLLAKCQFKGLGTVLYDTKHKRSQIYMKLNTV